MSTMQEKKDNFINAWYASDMSLTRAIRELAEYNMTTHYVYMKKDPVYASKIELGKDKLERKLDIAEDALIANIKKGNQKAIEFFLLTHGKERGYSKNSEQNINVNHRAIALIEQPMSKETFKVSGEKASNFIPKDEEDLKRLSMERFGEEVIIDVSPE